MRIRLLLTTAVLAGAVGPAVAQQTSLNTYSWANVPSAAALTGAGYLNGFDPTVTAVVAPPNDGTAFLQLVGSYGPPTRSLGNYAQAVVQPTLTAATAANTLLFANNPAFGGWALAGGGNTLTLGGVGSLGLATRGTAPVTVTNALLASTAAATPLLTVGSGSTLTLTGSTSVTGATLGTVLVGGGTLTLDNAGTNVPGRLAGTGIVTVQGAGTLNLIGNAAGGTYALGPISTADNSLGGTNTIRVTPNTAAAATTLNFANTGTFSLRRGTRNALRVEAASGTLGSATGPQVTFAGTPFTGTGGLLSNSAGGGTVGFGTVSDANGVNFATYATAPGATGIVSVANPNQAVATVTTVTDAAGLQAGPATTNVQFNAPASVVSLTGNVTGASLRITPAAAGGSLDVGLNNVVPTATMLDGPFNYAITGGTPSNAPVNAAFSQGATRYFYVNNPATTLSTTLAVASGTNPSVFAGPGTVALTGAASQNLFAAASNNRFTIAGGVLRGSNAQLNFTSAGVGGGVFNLTGGVLEITGGTNGIGASADFVRNIGTAGGTVNWGGGTAAEVGSGGFAAFGAPASVSIGGAGVTPLQWNTGGFVADGYALVLGSRTANNVITFQNPIALDGGTAGPYVIREVNVPAGAGGDRADLSGAITGSATADLLKTGAGTLRLTAASNYAGQTLVQAGRLEYGPGGSNQNTRTISINTGAVVDITPAGGTGGLATGQTLKGTGAFNGSFTAFPGSTVAPGLASPGTLTVTNGSVTFSDGSAFRIAVAAAAAATGVNTGTSATPGVSNSLLSATAGGITIIGGTLVVVDLTGIAATLNPASTYSFRIGDGTAGNVLGAVPGSAFTFVDGANDITAAITTQFVPSLGLTGAPANALYLNLVPVPEPAFGLLAAVGLLAVRRLRRA
jgi:autotransporter-associated beta strand protein